MNFCYIEKYMLKVPLSCQWPKTIQERVFDCRLKRAKMRKKYICLRMATDKLFYNCKKTDTVKLRVELLKKKHLQSIISFCKGTLKIQRDITGFWGKGGEQWLFSLLRYTYCITQRERGSSGLQRNDKLKIVQTFYAFTRQEF